MSFCEETGGYQGLKKCLSYMEAGARRLVSRSFAICRRPLWERMFFEKGGAYGGQHIFLACWSGAAAKKKDGRSEKAPKRWYLLQQGDFLRELERQAFKIHRTAL